MHYGARSIKHEVTPRLPHQGVTSIDTTVLFYNVVFFSGSLGLVLVVLDIFVTFIIWVNFDLSLMLFVSLLMRRL